MKRRWWVWAVGAVVAAMVVVAVLLVLAVVNLGVPSDLLGDVGSGP